MNLIEDRNSIAQIVHEKTVEILNEVGFCVPEVETLTRLRNEGFIVDHESNMVRVPVELIDQALSTLPKNINLYSRNQENCTDFNTRSYFMGAGTPVNVFDLDTGIRRPATRSDVRRLVKLQDALPAVDIVRPTVTATDQGEYSDLIEIAELLLNTSKPIVHRTLSHQRVDAAVEMLAAVAGGEQFLQSKPTFSTLYCPISPGFFTKENILCMLRWAQHGVPITILSMAMGGASAPTTLLGELIVINADILAWVTAMQILYPSTPLLYGSVSAVLDMRTGILPLGGPERGMINSGAAIMGHYYGIPSMCGGLSADAKLLDAQAGFEKAVTATPLLLEQASIIYGVGATDSGSTISYTQMIFDNEIIGGLQRMLQGIDVHNLDEEMAIIKANTPRGNFMHEKHTRKNYKQHWRPEILTRDAYDRWQEKGLTIEQICKQKAMDLLDQHESIRLPMSVEAEIERVLRRTIGDSFRID